MFEIPLVTTGTASIDAATAKVNRLNEATREGISAAKEALLVDGKLKDGATAYERALVRVATELENFNSTVYQQLRAANSLLTALKAPTDEYYRQVDALSKLAAQGEVYDKATRERIANQKLANGMVNAEVGALERLNKVLVDNAEKEKLVGNEKYRKALQRKAELAEELRLIAVLEKKKAQQSQTVAALRAEITVADRVRKIKQENALLEASLTDQAYKTARAKNEELKLKERLIRVHEQETAQLALAQTRLSALGETERKNLAIMQEKLRLSNAIAALQAKSNYDVVQLQKKYDALSGSMRRTTVAQAQYNANLHVSNQLTASLRAALSGMGTSFGIYTSATILMATAVYGLFRNLKETIAVGANYTDLLARVGAVSAKAKFGTDEYAGSLDALNAKALEISASTRFTATQVLEAMKELGMAGLSIENILLGVEDVMRLAAIGALSYGEAADIATNTLLGFGLEVANLTHVVDVMATAVTNSNQTIAQMGNAMSYAAPVAKSVGVSLEFTAAATMVLANSGIKASRAGTGLRRIFISLFAPTEKAAKMMKEYGIAIKDVGVSAEELEQIENPIEGLVKSAGGLDDFIKKLKQFYLATNGARENIDLLKEAVGVRALPAFIELIRGLERGEDSLLSLTKQLENTGGAAEDMFLKISQSLKADWEIMLGAIETLRLKLYDVAETGLKNFVQVLTTQAQMLARSEVAVKALVETFKSFATVVGQVLKVLVVFKSFLLLVGALQKVVAVGASVIGMFQSMHTKMLAMQAVAVGVTNTQLALGAAISTVGVAIGKFLVGGVVAAAIVGVGYLISKFVDLEAILGKVSGAFDSFKAARMDYVNETLIRTNELLNGGLDDLYAQRNAIQEQIAGYEAVTNRTKEQREHLKALKQEYIEINQQLARQKEFLDKQAVPVLTVRKGELESDLGKMEGQMNSIRSQIKDVRDQMSSGVSILNVFGEQPIDKLARLIGELNALESQSAFTKLELEEVGTALAELGKSPIERMQLFKKSLEGVAETITVLKDRQKLLESQLLQAGDKDSDRYKKLREELDQVTEALQKAYSRQSSLNAALKSAERDLSGFNITEITGRLDEVNSAFESYINDRKLSEEELTVATISNIEKRIASLQNEKDAAWQNVQRLVEEYQRLTASGEDTNKILVEITESTASYSGIVQALISNMSDLDEEKQKQLEAILREADMLRQIEAEYSKQIAMQQQLDQEFVRMNLLMTEAGWTAEAVAKGFVSVAEGIFEVDEKTGKLTDSSRKLLEENIKVQNALITEAELRRNQLEILRTEAQARMAIAAATGMEAEALAQANVIRESTMGSADAGKIIERGKMLVAGMEEVLNATFKAGRGARDSAKSNRDLARSYKELEPTIENYNKMLKEMNDVTEEGKAARDWVLKNQEALIKQGEDLNVILPKNKVELQAIVDQYDKAGAASREYAWQQKLLKALLDAGYLSLENYNKALDEQRQAYVNAQGPMAQYLEGLRQQIKFSEETAVDFLDKFRTGLIDTLAEGKNGFEDFANYVKKRLIELAVNTIFINVIGQVGLAGGSGVQSLTGGGGVGGLTSLSGLSKIPSFLSSNSIGSGIGSFMLGGQQNLMLAQQTMGMGVNSGWQNFAAGIGSAPNWALAGGGIAGSLLGNLLFGGKGHGSIGSSVGGTAGSLIAAGLGAGPVGMVLAGLLGGVGGGFLGSLTGDKTQPRAQWIATPSGGGFEDSVYARSEGLGINFGLGGKSHKVEASEYLPQLQIFAAAADTIAAVLGKDVADAISKAIGGTTDQMKGSGLAVDGWSAEGAFKQIFDQILGFAADTGDAMAILLEQRVGTLSGSLEEMAMQIQRAAAEVVGIKAFADTLELLGFNLGDTELAALQAAAAISDFAGGIEALAAKQAFYYENFYTEQEKAQHLYDLSTGKIEELNAELGLSGDAMIDTREELRAFVDSLDLTTEAGQKAYATAMDLAPEILNVEKAMETLDGTAGETTAALLGLAENLRAVAMAISETIASSREEIEKFGLSNRQLYERNVEDIARMQEEMKFMVNPADIESHAKKILDLAMENWNLLDDFQKGMLKDSFLKWMDEFDLFTADQLERIANEEGLEVDATSLDDLAANLGNVIVSLGGAIDSLSVAIQAQQAAAGSTEASAGALSAASSALASAAAAMPREVNVTVNLVGPTSELG